MKRRIEYFENTELFNAADVYQFGTVFVIDRKAGIVYTGEDLSATGRYLRDEVEDYVRADDQEKLDSGFLNLPFQEALV